MSEGLRYMNLSPGRHSPGTLMQLGTLSDVVVGANVVCLKSGCSAVKDKEYTVTAVTAQSVTCEARGSRFNTKPADFLQRFARRLGPVLEVSIRKGLVAKATFDGKTYKTGEVITLVETGGCVFDFRDSAGKKAGVAKQEFFTVFVYI